MLRKLNLPPYIYFMGKTLIGSIGIGRHVLSKVLEQDGSANSIARSTCFSNIKRSVVCNFQLNPQKVRVALSWIFTSPYQN